MTSRRIDPIHFPQAKIMNECAPGALVSYGDLSLVIANTSSWDDDIGTPIRDVTQRLKSLLIQEYQYADSIQIRQLKTDVASSFAREQLKVPGVLFPAWMRCTRCGLMKRLPWLAEELHSKPIQERFPLKCVSCKGLMVFSPYVLIHEDGWLDDLPWFNIAHLEAKSEQQKPKTEKQKACKHWDRLYLTRNDKGIEVIRCGHCGSETPTSGLFAHDFVKDRIGWMNAQPWEKDAGIELDRPPIAVDLSDGRIHIPAMASAIDIPPESRKNPKDLGARIRSREDFTNIQSYREQSPARFQNELKKLSRYLNESLESIEAVFAEGESSVEIPECDSQKDVFRAEYDALITPLSNIYPDERFIPVHRTDTWRTLSEKPGMARCGIIDRLVTLERLREVQVFCGFNRVSDDRSRITPDAEGWLPGCELFGEGLFFSLDTEILEEWEKQESVQERIIEINRRLENSEFRMHAENLMLEEDVIPRFVLLHTLTHLVARELEFHCGYPLSSIKERIYASHPSEENAAGALLYVTAADEYGTLGGLIECSHAESFSRIFMDALQKSERCSLDPVCAEHLGQGPDLLNLAACHNCCLVPETSCQLGNLFLDRQLLVSESFGLLTFLNRL